MLVPCSSFHPPFSVPLLSTPPSPSPAHPLQPVCFLGTLRSHRMTFNQYRNASEKAGVPALTVWTYNRAKVTTGNANIYIYFPSPHRIFAVICSLFLRLVLVCQLFILDVHFCVVVPREVAHPPPTPLFSLFFLHHYHFFLSLY